MIPFVLGWGPHAYFQMLESVRSTNISASNLQNQRAEERSNAGPSGVCHNGNNPNDSINIGPSGTRHNGSNLVDLESGRIQRN